MGKACTLFLTAVCLLALTSVARATDLEGFDEPIAETAAGSQHARIHPSDLASSGALIVDAVAQSAPSSNIKQEQKQQLLNASNTLDAGKSVPWAQARGDLRFEILAAAALVLYLMNLLWGRSQNIALAAEWTTTFTSPGGVLDRNFAAVGGGSGAGQKGLVKESQNQFKLYASGRRFCQGMMCTLNLQARQDLLSQLVALVDPKEDTLQVEVYMNESAMPLSVMAVAVPKVMRALVTAQEDISSYSKPINVVESTLTGWPKEKVHVRTEHSTLFYELMGDSRILSTFTASPNKAGLPAQLKYFRSMHFTADNGEGSHKQILRFTFAIPPKGSIADMAPLMALVPLCIDAVASYKMSPEVRKRAIESRSKAEATSLEDARKAIAEAIAAKKTGKILQEKERISKLSPEARHKYEEKQNKLAVKSALKNKIRMK